MKKITDYIFKIKHLYEEKFGETSFDLAYMIQKLDLPEYNNFAKCTVIVQKDEFCLLTYSLIKGGDSDLKTNPDSIYRDLRGTVLDMKEETLVSLPFHKFFNINEIAETQLPLVLEKIKSAKILELTDKMDGSMITVSLYKGKPFIAGSGSLSSEKNSRLDEAREFLTSKYIALIESLPSHTFMFELIGKEPQIVKYPRDKWGLYLTGARNKESGELLTYSELDTLSKKYEIPMVSIETHTVDEVLSMRDKFSCLEKEGWVLRVDDTLYKIKCEDFLNMHYLSTTSPSGILSLWRENKLDDLKARMSEPMKKFIEDYEKKFSLYAQKLDSQIQESYKRYSNLESMKDFALAIKKEPSRIQGFLFAIKRNKPLDLFKGITYQEIEDYLGENHV